MVRMSDILKKIKERQEKAKEEKIPSQPTQEQVVKPQPPGVSKEEKPIRPQPKHEVRISESVIGRPKLLDEEESLKLYEDTLALIKDIYDKAKVDKEMDDDDKAIISQVEKFVNQQCLNNDNILCLINFVNEDNFVYSHVINVCIISIEIGIGLRYDKTKLIELGVAAMVHDIGMVKYQDLYNKPSKLSRREYNEIKNHSSAGAKILKKFKNISKKSISVAEQEHERIDGSGYPNSLKANSISEYSKIIQVVDVYEAITHWRPHRSAINPSKALEQLIDSKDSFERKIMKILIERLTCPYPPCSYVKLSTGEKGIVIKRNLKFPLRPVIEIIYSADGEELKEAKTIDLAIHSTIYIERHLRDDEI